MADITNVTRKYYEINSSTGAITPSSWEAPAKNIRFLAGYANNNNNFVGVIKFVLPKAAKSITFNFVNSSYARSEKQNLRFKFVTSEDESLIDSINTAFQSGSNVVGDSSVTTTSAYGTNGDTGTESFSGKFKIYKNGYAKTAVTFNKTLRAGTHYIYIWSDDYSVKYNFMDVLWQDTSNTYSFTASYEESESAGAYVYIDNGTSFDAYEIWIDNGSKWEQYIAYIDNGTSWDECG